MFSDTLCQISFIEVNSVMKSNGEQKSRYPGITRPTSQTTDQSRVLSLDSIFELLKAESKRARVVVLERSCFTFFEGSMKVENVTEKKPFKFQG